MKLSVTPRLSFVFFVLGSSCTTTSPLSKEPEQAREVVVFQQNRSEADIDARSREEWVSVFKDAKTLEGKMYAVLATGSWTEAENFARAELRKNPGHPTLTAGLALALAAQGKTQVAAFYARENRSALGGNLRGLALTQIPGQMENAILEFDKAFRSSDKEIAAGMNLAYAYLESGQSSMAANIFGEVRQRCQDCVRALLGHGVALQRLKQRDPARSAFNLVLKKSSKNTQAMYRLALLAAEEKQMNVAKEHLQELMRNNPDAETRRRGEDLLASIQRDRPGASLEEDFFARSELKQNLRE